LSVCDAIKYQYFTYDYGILVIFKCVVLLDVVKFE
jgi:hypothetical protein